MTNIANSRCRASDSKSKIPIRNAPIKSTWQFGAAIQVDLPAHQEKAVLVDIEVEQNECLLLYFDFAFHID